MTSIVIFDWDDSLLPTTYISQVWMRLLHRHLSLEDKFVIDAELDHLSNSILELFDLLFDRCIILVVSNCLPVWIEESIKYMPKLISLMGKHEIICCRPEHPEDKCSNGVYWKYKCFKEIMSQFKENMNDIQFISIGDSENERGAALSLKKDYNNLLIKNIKLKDTPTIKECNKQIVYLKENIYSILDNKMSMDVYLDIIKGQLIPIEVPFTLPLIFTHNFASEMQNSYMDSHGNHNICYGLMRYLLKFINYITNSRPIHILYDIMSNNSYD